MKLFNWIASNKIVVGLPLLAFLAVGIFVLTHDRDRVGKENSVVAESYPSSENRTTTEPVLSAAPNELPAGTSKVVFLVDNMSCSGCIATIKGSLAGYAGIRDIIVDIAGGTTEVYYDAAKIKDVNNLASSITASGYPARVDRILTADQIKKEETLAASRAKLYVASVSGWDIARSDFDTELDFACKRYQEAYGKAVFTTDQGKILLDNLKAQVVSRLINEGIQMQEVQRAGYMINHKIVDQAFDEFLTQKELDLEGLKASLQKNGYPFEYFMKRFENSVRVRHYLDEKVFAETASDYDRQKQYQAWFANARELSKVKIYDRELKQLTRSQSAGSGCGGSTGGSCCATTKS
jgi:copper chaperone CopZ